MDEKKMGSLPYPSTAQPRVRSHMSSPRALGILAAFLALPFGLVLLLSHRGFLGPAQISPPLQHHAPINPSLLEEVEGHVKGHSSANAQLQIQFCEGENLRRCVAYPYDGGCTKIDDFKVLSLAEPRYFDGRFSGCTVYRKHVDDCAEDAEDPGSWKEVKDFVINWDVKGEWPEYAFNGHVPRVEASWAWDIGSFQCK